MKRNIILIILLCGALAAAFGAGLSVPEFGIITNGSLNDDGLFELSTRIALDMLVQGGAKFAAWFKLGFNSATLEDYLAALNMPSPLPDSLPADDADLLAAIRRLEQNSGLNLKTAAIAFNGAFDTPLDLTLFVGSMDVIGSGMDYPALFGSQPFASKLRGFLYYPQGIKDNPSLVYDGLHEVYGTGIRVSMPGERFVPSLYLYQDSYLGGGKYSVDARAQYNAEGTKFEAFLGASFPEASLGVYRGGLLFYYDTGSIGSFYAQLGVPRWDPMAGFDMSLFYFLFEPRFDFGPGMLTITVFHHPGCYLQASTGEAGFLELRADLGFGDLNAGTAYGGVESEISYDPNAASSPLSLSIGPYFQTLWSGVKVDLRLDIKAFPVPAQWYGMFSPSLGVSASF
jgi:hypothetical protein